MNADDHEGYMAASVLTVVGMVIGYTVPALGIVVVSGLGLLLIAAWVGDGAGDGAGDGVRRAMAPLRALRGWFAWRDASTWLRWAPFIGAVAGGLLNWAADGLKSSGGA